MCAGSAGARCVAAAALVAQHDLISPRPHEFLAVLVLIPERLELLDRRQLEISLRSAVRHSAAERGRLAQRFVVSGASVQVPARAASSGPNFCQS